MGFSRTRLIRLRKDAELTQAEMADRVSKILGKKCSRATYQTYETGRVIPPQTMLDAICKVLNVSRDYLYTLDIPEGVIQQSLADNDLRYTLNSALELVDKLRDVNEDTKPYIKDAIKIALALYDLNLKHT